MKTFNILIIEDELLIALNIKQILERNNYNVVGIAQDSESAIQYVKENSIQLILSDIRIKGDLNGIKTVKLIQESFNISAIFLTAHQEDNILKETSEVDFLGYIVKPFLEDTIIREVKLAYFKYCNETKKNTIKLTSHYTYNLETQVIQDCSTEVTLGKQEQIFLHILISNSNQIVQNKHIDALLWYDKAVDDATRRQLLFRLRKKLPELDIETIKGVGYTLKLIE